MYKDKNYIVNRVIAKINSSKLVQTKFYTLAQKHLSHKQDRIAAGTMKTTIMNFVVIICKIGMSIYYRSTWFAINAAFYLVICVAYTKALRKYVEVRKITSQEERYKKEYDFYEKSGVFVVLLGVTYFMVCLWMYMKDYAVIYNGEILNITVTLIAFCKITTAIMGVISYKNMKNPLIYSIKIIALIDAIVSIVVAQCTLINMSGDYFSAIKSSSLFGMACSGGFIVIGVRMLFKNKKIRKGDSFNGKN